MSIDYYVVAEYPTDIPETVADSLEQKGFDVLHVSPDSVLVSSGPFPSTSKNLAELRGDARRHLEAMVEGARPRLVNIAHAQGVVWEAP